MRIQVRAEEAWLPPPCFAASHQVPTHLETYLNASIFPDQNVKKLKRRSRWEIACRRIKSLHRMPGRPHYPPYWASFTRSPAPQPYGYQCPMLAITRENNNQCLGNGVLLTCKVYRFGLDWFIVQLWLFWVKIPRACMQCILCTLNNALYLWFYPIIKEDLGYLFKRHLLPPFYVWGRSIKPNPWGFRSLVASSIHTKFH